MLGFGSRHHKYYSTHRRHHRFHHKNPNRQAAGYKAALHNPATSSAGRAHAKHELRRMGRSREAHVPLSTRIKHFLGMGRHRHHQTHRRARRDEPHYNNEPYYESRTTTRRRRY